MTDVRTPPEEDRDQVVEVLRVSLNFPAIWIEHRGPTLPLEDIRCVYEGDRVVATASEYHLRQWFAGCDLPMAGIFAVGTLPERRATGLAGAAVEQILREARERGVPVSALYPAVLRPYRKLGYELAGTFTRHRLPLDAIPPVSSGDDVEELDPQGDLESLKQCFHRSVRGGTGTIEPDDAWWTRTILNAPSDKLWRAVVVRGEDGSVDGFAVFLYADAPGHLDVDFGLDRTAFAATTDRAARALLGYFRGYRGIGQWVEWAGPPNDPIVLLIPEQKVDTSFSYRWILRSLDVEVALEERGYPPIDAEAVFAVEDPMFPENAGPWSLRVTGGKASVERVETAVARPIPIGALSSMFTGYLRPADAVRLGYLDADDAAVPALARSFDGPDPWCPFFF